MKKCKSNLTGEAIFTVEVRGQGGTDWQTVSTHGSATPCNKAAYAMVKACLADTPDGAKRLYTGRPDLGYIVTEVVPGETGEVQTVILQVRVRLNSKTAHKTWVDADASLAARKGTLAKWERKEPITAQE